jgi:hypothetical protein
MREGNCGLRSERSSGIDYMYHVSLFVVVMTCRPLHDEAGSLPHFLKKDKRITQITISRLPAVEMLGLHIAPLIFSGSTRR